MKRQKVLETCLVISTGFILLFYIFHVKILILIAFIIGLTGIFIKPLATGIAILWEKFGNLLGYIISKFVLTIVFFIFLFQIAILENTW
jgi:hypothetical protein